MTPSGRRLFLALLCTLLPACGPREPATEPAELSFLHVVDPLLVAADTGPEARAAALANREALGAALRSTRSRDRSGPVSFLVIAGNLEAGTPASPAAGGATGGTAAPGTTPPGTTPPATTPPATTPPGDTTTGATTTGTTTTGATTTGTTATGATTTGATTTGATAAGTTAGDAAAGGATTGTELDMLVATLAASPVTDLFFVPSPTSADVASGLAARLRPSGVYVHDLTACGQAGARANSGCVADVRGTDYRLVGFALGTGSRADSVRTLERLDSLVAVSAGIGKRVIVVSGSPLGAALYAPAPAPTPGAAPANAAAAPAPIWQRVLARDAVIAVLTDQESAGNRSAKVLQTPMLGSTTPDASLASTRALGRIRIAGGEVRSTTLRYEQAFTGPGEEAPGRERQGLIRRAIGWLWNLPANAGNLAKAVIVAIALLAAFLTIAALWRLQDGTPENPAPGPGQNAPTPADPIATAPTVAFSSNFARTVLSGLGGLVALSFIQIAWQNLFPDANPFYVVVFVTMFLLLLLGWGLARGFTEALRSRIANPYQPPVWSPPGGKRRVGRLFVDWLWYWLGRLRSWILSYRATVLVFLDTVLAILLGRNQLKSKIWEETIIELHWSLHGVIEEVRKNLSAAVEDSLRTPPVPPGGGVAPVPGQGAARVRVNISLLAEDGRSVYYIASEPGSLAALFPPQSVAWVSIVSGEPRWFTRAYRELGDRIVLHKVGTGQQPLPGIQETEIMLASFLHDRPGSDYDAFIVLPVPRRRGGLVAGRRRGAIHISFASERDFAATWNLGALPATPGEKIDIYQDPERVFGEALADECLRKVLTESMDVLGEAIQNFNEAVFTAHIRPCRER